jgi:hypothetical protein
MEGKRKEQRLTGTQEAKKLKINIKKQKYVGGRKNEMHKQNVVKNITVSKNNAKISTNGQSKQRHRNPDRNEER